MGMLVNGVWEPDTDLTIRKGHFVRENSGFGEVVLSSVVQDMANSSNRFAIIASLSCPWSHRVLLVRTIKKLQAKLPLIIAGEPRVEGYGVDTGQLASVIGLPNIRHMHQLYTLSDPEFTGRVTVPVLWDKSENRIISNDSQNIMRALDRVDHGEGFSLVPADLAEDIHELNASIHENLANAVYRAGLAQNQQAYDEAVNDVFNTLGDLENRLHTNRYLFGEILTETDLRLFATLVRFDAVYATHFRCTRHRLTEYPNLWGYARDLYASYDLAETVDFKANQKGYYLNDGDNNPHHIVPDLPSVNWHEPHNREKLGQGKLWSRSHSRSNVSI